MRALLLGETWLTTPMVTNGVDSFFARSTEVDSSTTFRRALESHDIEVTHLRSSQVNTDFPDEHETLARYDAIIMGDIGSRTLLLHPGMYSAGGHAVDRTALIAEYVTAGGGLIMVGGYLSYSGYGGMAGYARTRLAEVLPVLMSDADDTVERPDGVSPVVIDPHHPALADVPYPWPALLGYNRVVAREGATVAATLGGDPLLVTSTAGRGRVAAFTTDCAPHWASAEFLQWSGYAPLMAGMVRWVARSSPDDEGRSS